MNNIDWVNEFPGGVTVCDAQGILISLNKHSEELFADRGGSELIGTNLADCHNQHSNEIIRELMDEQRTNIYTVEENGKKELVIQAPWYQEGQFSGLVEITIMLHGEILNIVR